MIRVVHPGSRIRTLTISHPGSQIQGSKRHPIPDPGSATLWERYLLDRDGQTIPLKPWMATYSMLPLEVGAKPKKER
jgi:hypothetical protein